MMHSTENMAVSTEPSIHDLSIESFNGRNFISSTPFSTSVNYEEFIDFKQFSSEECSLILSVIGKDQQLKNIEKTRLE